MMDFPCCWEFGCECSHCQEDIHEWAGSLGLEPSDIVHFPIDEYNLPETPPRAYTTASNQEQTYGNGLDRSVFSSTATDGSGSGVLNGGTTEQALYTSSGLSSLSSQQALSALAALATSQPLVDRTTHSQHLTEQIALSHIQTVFTDPIESNCGSLQVPTDQPHTAHLSSGDPAIMCPFPECRGRTFGRVYEYKRHYNRFHAENPTVYWCEVVGCERSVAEGGDPFSRKDHRDKHMRQMHRA